MTLKFIPYLGRQIRLVPRHLMRRTTHGRTLRVPSHLLGLVATVPTPPPTFDGSKGRQIKYTCWWNNQYGDCYEEDALHCILTWTGNVGTPAAFDKNAILREYTALSGGDNGLGDDQVFPHWKSVGFQGHKILDDLTVDPRDDNAIRLGLWKFYGGSYTASLPDAWLVNPKPGDVWDAATPNPSSGHAMHLSGYTSGYYQDETWGFPDCIKLTPAGLKSSDPEVTIQFSLDMFNAQGIAPDGETYQQKADLWHTLGGITLPPWPGSGPGPVNPPSPPVPVPPVNPPLPPIASLKQQLDAVFANARNVITRTWAKWAQRPALVALDAVQKQVDAILAQYSSTRWAAGALVPSVAQILDAAFAAAEAAMPQYAMLLKIVQRIMDTYLARQR